MKESIRKKLVVLSERHQKLSTLLSNPDVAKDQNSFRDLSKEYAQIEPVVECYRRYVAIKAEMQDAKVMLEEEDADIKNLALDEIAGLEEQLAAIENELHLLLLPDDPNDDRNVYLEIRAGTGGDEAAIFAGDLFRMYARYAENRKWRMELISEHEGDHGGYKEVIIRVIGKGGYAKLKFESGGHRVQRVPITESSGRIHTSACTVAVMPEAKEVDFIDINPADLRTDTYRSQGAGGQHVNTTDSAVRITHIPTNTVVECQDERSQHKNRAKAMALLQTKLLENERNKQHQEQAATRKSLIGSGDRSTRIRTYNFPQGRITDHRINLTLYKLEEVLAGNLDPIIEALSREHQADLLASFI